MELIDELKKVTVDLLKSNPASLSITATGTVPSLGWTNPLLAQRFYVDPPEDGIQDYDCIATPPFDPSATVTDGIVAHYFHLHIPEWLQGVRVHSKSGSMEVMLGDLEGIKI